MNCEYLPRLSFFGEWFQEEASVARPFFIYFYPDALEIEIYDQKTKKLFLRRTEIDSLTESDFFIGAKLNILGRKIDILDYADSATRTKLENLRKSTLLIIKFDLIASLGEILNILTKNSFKIINAQMVQLNVHDLARTFGNYKENDFNITEPIFAFEVIADGAIEKLKTLVGPSNSAIAEKESPNSLRALFKQNGSKNCIYCSQNDEDATRQVNYFFKSENSPKTMAILEKSTLGIIKPHAIKEGKCGEIISDIVNSGFNITALKMITLEKANSEEFYEVYRGVLPEFLQMVSELSSGKCMVIELVTKDSRLDSQTEFRQLCGPLDPDIAKQIRPNTLRAKYGKNKFLNAIHCTDLPEDTLLELEYFFKILE